jgi:pyruvate dehydrogenase E1 component alpha subunit
VCICFFGEGALGQGVLYEVMNMAALWKLPVIYVCENNLYNEYTHYSETTAGDILTRAAGFGLKTESVDGQDVRAVNTKAEFLVERTRSGEGPAFLLCNTYRFMGHHVGDVSRGYYRPKEEEADWRMRDPLIVLTDWMAAQNYSFHARIAEIQTEVKQEIEKAVQFALAAPYPAVDKVDQDVYA